MKAEMTQLRPPTNRLVFFVNLKRKELGMIRKVLVSAWSLDSENNVSFEGNYKEKEVNIMFQHKTSTELC